MAGRKVWHIRMRQDDENGQRDYSGEAITKSYIGIGLCASCGKYLDPVSPRNISDAELEQIELHEGWSKNQGKAITQFIRTIQPDDVILLAREKGTGNLAVGLVTEDIRYVANEKLPIRRSVNWKSSSYDRSDLLGYQFYGLATLKRMEVLDKYAEDILAGRTIQIESIHFSDTNRNEAVQKIKERFKALYPSYFEDLVGFIAEQNGLHVDRFMKGQSNDAGVDLRGWRAPGIFEMSKASRERLCIQVKRRVVRAKDMELLSTKVKPGVSAMLVTSENVPHNLRKKASEVRIEIIDGNQLAECVLELHNKLPSYLNQMFRITRDD